MTTVNRDDGLGSPGGSLLSPSRIGDVNRSRVLQAFCDHGPLSRADLARMAGVTRATIGNIIQGLLDDGIVEVHDPVASAGKVGKPARPIWFAARAGLCGAAAIGPGTFKVALVNARGDVLDQTDGSFDAAAATPDALVAALSTALAAVLPHRRAGLIGIGVAVPGVCDTAKGTVAGSGQVPGIAGAALVRDLAAKFGQRVLIDNDARAQALGEKWFGDGRGVPSFASVQTGHGLGVGLVLGGLVFRGQRGMTGELGHTCVVLDGERCRCGLQGCWETVATLGWLRREAKKLHLRGASKLDAASLLALGTPEADELAHRYADNLALGLANLVQLLDPQRIILHGDVVGGGQPLLDLVTEATRARCLPHLAGRVDIKLSSLDQRAGLLGAAGLVLSETFSLAT